MTSQEKDAGLLIRRLVWAGTAMLALGIIALVRVPTYLGVKVVEANRESSVPLTRGDFRGSDYLWRVWWRAWGEFVDVSPGWLLGAALLAGLAVFLVGVFGAYRLALSMPRSPARGV